MIHIGYGGDVSNGQRPLYHDTPPMYSVRSYSTSSGTKTYLMKHSIDTMEGHLGGPVFAFLENAPCIVQASDKLSVGLIKRWILRQRFAAMRLN